MVTRINAQGEAIDDLYSSCKQRHFDFNATTRFSLGNDIFRSQFFGVQQNSLKTVRTGNDPFISFYVNVPLEAPDTFIYEIATVSYYENATTTPVAMEYHGPKYVIYNSTSECMQGLKDSPTKNSIYAKCDVQKHVDSRLNDWRPVDDYGKPLAPTVQHSQTESLIQCMFVSSLAYGT